MRALLVCAAPVPGSAGLIAELAPAHELVIGVDGGASLCAEAEVVPNLIVGDLDSLGDEAARTYERQGVEVVRFPTDKTRTDLDLALDAARSAGANSVTVTAASAGRLDHTLAMTGALLRNLDLAPCIEEPELRGWLVAADGVTTLSLLGRGSTVSIFALDGTATVSCSGMRWPLSHHCLECLSSEGLSNLLDAPEGLIEVHRGRILVLSSLVEDVPPARKAL